MDWRIGFDNDVILEFRGRSMADVADIAAYESENDGCRVIWIACGDHTTDIWHEEDQDVKFWKKMCELFPTHSLAHIIWQMMDCVQDDYLMPEYQKEWDSLKEASLLHPVYSDAIDPAEQEEMDSDLEDALDDMAGDPLDMMKALLDPEDVLRDFDRKLQPFSQDTAELDPSELWKGFGI